MSIISKQLGLKQDELEVLTASPAAYYTDPWKSDEKVKTVVLKTNAVLDLAALPQGCQYFAIPLLEGGVQSLIELARREDSAIDCDMY